ncbi:hypothetical protein BGW38_005659 [Lunasporangiospora selenospora]|uniref:Oligopeptide transporter, OPT family n=1 Tax=Lunasporangiospora selenospora TaxID=979761 RepID=A0A9P6FZF7_9FUNG|nr:hypothetical protein BGW38_005659 [Lunasporangiospora selenospora]
MSAVAYSAVPSDENGHEQDQPHGPSRREDPYKNLPHFTWRSVIVGILIGTLLCFTNMYFGLQTGWISMMSLQSSLLGFAIFKTAASYKWTATSWFFSVPFGPAENIVLQSIAVATGTMPLAAGFVGIIPALQMMTKEDNPIGGGPIFLSGSELILWCLAIAFFGVFIAVPLRKQVIIREKLPFPSGTATAQMIGVLHNAPLVVEELNADGAMSTGHHHQPRQGRTDDALRQRQGRGENGGERERVALLDGGSNTPRPTTPSRTYDSVQPASAASPSAFSQASTLQQPLGSHSALLQDQHHNAEIDTSEGRVEIGGEDGDFSLDKTFLEEDNWRINMTALAGSFAISGLYTILSYFIPMIAAIPVFDWLSAGTIAFGTTWQWFFTPSFSYIGQGVIMGFPTTASMLLGCVVGWGILSPLATLNKWVTGPVGSSTTGARGWILWISLGVMIAESIVSLLGIVVLSLAVHYRQRARKERLEQRRQQIERRNSANNGHSAAGTAQSPLVGDDDLEDDLDADEAPEDQLVPLKLWVCGLILSTILCLILIRVVFKDQHMPVYATALALILGSLLAVLGVRALGSTDLNPVSGIGKVSQFVFAGIVPGGIVANLIAGGIAEAGAQQAGDLMQDLKTGHLMGASPKAQFWGQMIGSFASVFISTAVYKLYTAAYEIPGQQFPVPTAKVWLDLARLVNGHSLPDHTVPFVLGFSLLFAGLTLLTTVYSDAAFLKSGRTTEEENGNEGGNGEGHEGAGKGGLERPKWLRWVPSGIAFAIGMYNLPNFTLARFVGGVVSVGWDWYCRRWPTAKYAKQGRVFLIIIASGFVLGEGSLSIVKLILKTYNVHSWSCAGCLESICECN